MGRSKTNRVASFLAALFWAVVMGTGVQSEGLTLPQSGSDPITLALSDLAGAAASPAAVLAVFVGSADPCCGGRTPLAGRYGQSDAGLTFSPAFGFDPGQDYVARVQTAEGAKLIAFRIPTVTAPVPAEVTEVFPSGEALPENVLRFYFHFSVPMTPHVAFDHIRLRDAAGDVDDAAFMRFKQELWNPDRTRLTVLIDPGRIKREVATNAELGPALIEGQRYTLEVEAGWPSADGSSTLPAFSRTFQVSSALRDLPDARNWSVDVPCAGTREPLTIAFDRPFDRHLLARSIGVATAAGAGLEGAIEIRVAERGWRFTPHQNWPDGDVRLVVDPTLEDVAGNNFRDLLDHVASAQPGDPTATELPLRLGDCAG